MFTVNQAVQDVKSAIAILANKKLTNKQLTYTYNVVIISRVEYHIQLVHLSE
ncbi:15721_t:CDS:1, partial [Funneliformis caledonium]